MASPHKLDAMSRVRVHLYCPLVSLRTSTRLPVMTFEVHFRLSYSFYGGNL